MFKHTGPDALGSSFNHEKKDEMELERYGLLPGMAFTFSQADLPFVKSAMYVQLPKTFHNIACHCGEIHSQESKFVMQLTDLKKKRLPFLTQ